MQDCSHSDLLEPRIESRGEIVRLASAETPGPRPIARTEGRKILATIPTVDAEDESETDRSHLVHASTKLGRSNSCARSLGRERRFFANADVTVRRDPCHRRLRDRCYVGPRQSGVTTHTESNHYSGLGCAVSASR